MTAIIITALVYFQIGVGLVPQRIKVPTPRYSQKKYHR